MALPTSNMSSGWDFLILRCLASRYASTPLTVCDNWPSCGACVSAVTALLPFMTMKFVFHFLCVGILPTYCCSVANQSSLCLWHLILWYLCYSDRNQPGCEPTFCASFQAQFSTYHNIFCDNRVLLRTSLMSFIISCIMWTVVPSFANYVIHCLPSTAQWTHYSCKKLAQLCTRLECMKIWTYPIFLLMSKTKFIV